MKERRRPSYQLSALSSAFVLVTGRSHGCSPPLHRKQEPALACDETRLSTRGHAGRCPHLPVLLAPNMNFGLWEQDWVLERTGAPLYSHPPAQPKLKAQRFPSRNAIGPTDSPCLPVSLPHSPCPAGCRPCWIYWRASLGGSNDVILLL